MLKKDAIGANARVTVKRTDFNAGNYAPYIGDDVRIDIAVEAIKELVFQPTGGHTMSQPEIAQKSPFAVDVEAGKSYWWCSCGKSKSQPFCDGSHKGSEFSPVEYKAQQSGPVYFCGCKHSKNGVTCDGSHKSL